MQNRTHQGRIFATVPSYYALCATAMAALTLFLVAGGQAQASFPGANGKIAFTLGVSEDQYQLGIVNSDGSDYRQLTNLPDKNARPNWSADGQKLAFARFPDAVAGKRIYTANGDAVNATQADTGLADNDASWDSMPSWSPDGTKLAFMSNREGDNDIYTVGSDGGGLAKLSDTAVYPDWSPDGATIVFGCLRDGDLELCSIPATGGTETPLTPGLPGFDNDPDWSPDGKHVAFESDRDGNLAIWTVDADGTDPKLVREDPGFEDESPSWSPDGTKIAYSSTKAGSTDIYVVNADGTGDAVPVANDADQDEIWPDWQSVSSTDDSSPGTEPATAPGIGSDSTAPTIESLRVNHTKIKMHSLRSKPSKAVYFKFKLSEDASVKAKLYRRKKHSSKYTYLGSLTKSEKSGSDKLKVSTSLAKKLRRYARYKATLKATDAAGNESKSRSKTFRVVRS